MPAKHAPIARHTAKSKRSITLLPGVPDLHLPLARVHEACGPARMRFAMWLAAQTQGPIIWIAPEWGREYLNPCGFVHLIDPARLILVKPRRPEDALWSMEEVLRSGSIELAIADLSTLPNLTQVRRMHLAAEHPGQNGKNRAPIGLLLTPGTGGAPGVETRWFLAPDHVGRPGRWRLDRLRARTAPQTIWHLASNRDARLPTIQPVITHA